jgi:hypothetical protein
MFGSPRNDPSREKSLAPSELKMMGEATDPGKSIRYGAAVEEGSNGQAVDAFSRRTAGTISGRTFVNAPLNSSAAVVGA